MQATDPLGLVTKYTYDNLGRELTETQVSDTYPAGLTTSYTYDGLDRLVTETDPPVTDRVTGAVHTKVTSYTYDADSNMLTTTISDATGGDPSRTTTNTYNAHGELASTTDALGNTTRYTYDALGDRVSRDQPRRGDHRLHLRRGREPADHHAGRLHRQPGQPDRRRRTWCEESRAYDPAGRLASVTNVGGHARPTTPTTATTSSRPATSSARRAAAECRASPPTPTTRPATGSPRPIRAAWSSTRPTTPTTRWSRRRWTRPGWTVSTTATYDADGNVDRRDR